MKKYAIKILNILVATLFWVGIWYAVAAIVDLNMIVPMPHTVFRVLTELIITPDFWVSTLYSILRVMIGILISICLGGIIAYAVSASKICNAIISPMISVIKATPVASFIVIAFLWFSTSALPSFIATLVVIPIIVANLSQGISSVDPQLKEVARIYRFSPIKKLKLLYVPSIFPYFLTACKASFGMAWKASVAAELIVATKRSIGEALYYGKQNFEAENIFAWTIVIVILSVLSEKLSIILLNKLGEKVSLKRKGDRHAADR